LKTVLLGSVERMAWPTHDREFQDTVHSKTNEQKSFDNLLSEKIISETKIDLEKLQAIMTDKGVQVYRPNITHTHWAYSARDILLTVGNKLIQCPTPYSSRANEIDLYPILKEANGEIIKAPRPKGKNDPMFDAANVLKVNDKLVYSLSHSANEQGADWLQQQVGTEFEVIKWQVLDHNITHIDSTLLSLNDKVVLVNASRVKDDQLPFFMRDYKKIWVEDVRDRNKSQFLFASKWIGMNVLSLAPDTVVVDEIQIELADQLTGHGFDVVKTPMRHSRTLGGGLHCVTCDIERAVS